MTEDKSVITALRVICKDYSAGRSLTCLFAGEPGTGTSMAAE